MIAGLGGDAGAHKSLLERPNGHLRPFFGGRLPCIGRAAAEPEDLVQETLIAIHTRRNTYDPSQPLSPWVYAIARYKFLDHPRRTKTALREVPIEEAIALLDIFDHAPVLPRGRCPGRTIVFQRRQVSPHTSSGAEPIGRPPLERQAKQPVRET